MKWLIASDIHGSAYYCRKVLECFAREGAERLLLLGDVLYHGPRNDLPRDYAPKEVAAQLNAMADRVLGVRGNCDFRHARPPVRPRLPAAAARGRDPAVGTHARPALHGKSRDRLSQSRLGRDPQGGLAAQLYDARGRRFSLDRPGKRRGVPPLRLI